MDNNIELGMLYETYKELLTKNMRDVFELYFYSDLSLREIGEAKKVSFQAVNDTLKKVEKTLKEYEKKLGFTNIKKEITKLNNLLNENDVDLYKIKEIANKIGEM